MVTVGCFGEYTAEFTNWFTGGCEVKKTWLAKRSTLLLVGSLALELVCLVRTNQLSTEIIGSLAERAKEASEKAQLAIDKSSAAALRASAAEAASTRADDKSEKASASASNALSLAKGARQEADSFEKDIKQAKVDASEAKELLDGVRQLAADARKRAGNAESLAGSVERKVADRHISPEQGERIRESLLKWFGEDIQLPIISVNGDDEMWTYGFELLGAFANIPGWSVELSAAGANTGMSGLVVRLGPNSSAPEKELANDVVKALRNAGVQTIGPEAPAQRGIVFSGGRIFATGKFNSKDPRFDPKAHDNEHNVKIEIGRRM